MGGEARRRIGGVRRRSGHGSGHRSHDGGTRPRRLAGPARPRTGPRPARRSRPWPAPFDRRALPIVGLVRRRRAARSSSPDSGCSTVPASFLTHRDVGYVIGWFTLLILVSHSWPAPDGSSRLSALMLVQFALQSVFIPCGADTPSSRPCTRSTGSSSSWSRSRSSSCPRHDGPTDRRCRRAPCHDARSIPGSCSPISPVSCSSSRRMACRCSPHSASVDSATLGPSRCS